MQFKRVLIGFSVAVFFLLSTGCAPMPPADPLQGNPAPDFEIQSLQSMSLSKSLASCKGNPVILDFWATWCGPCKELTPYVESIYEEYKDKGVQAMAISDEARDTIQRTEKQHPHEMPVYVDQNDLATSAFDVKGLPTIIVVDRKGVVIFHTTGFLPGMIGQTATQIRNAVIQALKEPA